MPDDHPAANCGQAREEGVSRADIVGFLTRYKRVVARSTLAGMLLAFAYIAITPSIFTARAQLLLDPSQLQHFPRIAGEIQLAMDTPLIESQIAVLRSERIINAALEKLDLLVDPEFVAQRGWLARLTLQGEPTAFEATRAIIARVQSGLDVRRVGLSHAIDISFSSRIPGKAANVANAVAEAYVDDQIASRAQAARQGSEWLETRINGLRGQMNRAALAVQEFKARRDYRIPPRRDVADEPIAGQQEKNTLEELESTARTYRSIYESYLQAFTELVQRQTFSISGARVITLATPPLSKSKPKITLALITGTMLGLLGGLAVALLKHSIEPTVLSARQVRQAGLKFLGYVLDPERNRERRLVQQLPGRPAGFADSVPRRLRRFLASPLARARNGPSGRFQSDDAHPIRGQRGDDFSLALYVPDLLYCESIKTIASSIGLAGGARPVRRVGVMSVLPNASKSPLVSNLGILLAGAGNRTLVIDADLNTPVLSRALAPKCSIGLAELLADKAAVADCVIGAQFNGRPLPGLDILPVADNPPREAGEAAVGAKALRETLQKLEQSYDLILVDMPPARPLMAGPSLSSALDEIIIVAARPGTPLQLLTDVAYQFHVAGASHLGVVLSEWGARPRPMSDADRRGQRVTA